MICLKALAVVAALIVSLEMSASAKPVSWVGGSGAKVSSITCGRVLEKEEDAGELLQLAAAAASKLPSGLVNASCSRNIVLTSHNTKLKKLLNQTRSR